MEHPQIKLALEAWSWLATDPDNTEPLPPLVDNPENRQLSDAFGVGDAAIPVDSRRFQPALLHKKVMSKIITRPETEEVLSLLESIGVIGEPFLDGAARGRSRELRHISAEYLCFDNEEAHARLETKLTELLTKAINARQADHHAKVMRAKAEIALRIYDFLSDPENTEIDSRNSEVFSIKRISRDIDNTADGLRVLQQLNVIGASFQESTARERQLCKLNQEWFKPGGREKLMSQLFPEKPEPYQQAGPLRVLHDMTVFRSGCGQKLAAGTIVTNESLCKILVEGKYPVAPAQDTDACTCIITTCRHRFKVSESKPLDHPVLLVLQDFYFWFNKSSIRYNRGDLISRRDLVEYLTTGNGQWPISVAADAEFSVCPACGYVARRTVLLGEHLAAMAS